MSSLFVTHNKNETIVENLAGNCSCSALFVSPLWGGDELVPENTSYS